MGGAAAARAWAAVALATVLCFPAEATCPYHCHAPRGRCTLGSENVCECSDPWSAAPDCSRRSCPQGPAWFDYPQPDGSAHQLAECSNAGYCDGSTGVCVCQPGYTGDACQRSVCVADCSGHGECVSIRERAERYDGMQYKYKARYSSWDADMNFGCACHEGWTGPDCTMRLCPFGDDPMTQGTKEIQSVRTFADHRDEVQSILLTADYDIDEVQVVRVQDLKPATGDFPIIGTFALIFDTTDAGGACKICASKAVAKTTDIAMDAAATGSVGDSMREKMQDISPSVIDQVTVSRVDVTGTDSGGIPYEGFEWRITFVGDDIGGNVPQLQVTDLNIASGNDVKVTTWTEREGNEVNGTVSVVFDNTISRPAGGCFSKCFDGKFNVTVPYSARASELDTLIESLPNINQVSTEVRYIGGPGVLWLITFTRNYGDTAQLECLHNTSLSGYNNISNPTCDVTTIQDGYFLNGTFALRLGGAVTPALPWNVTREAMAIAIDALDSTFGGINVTRGIYVTDVAAPWEWTGAYEWVVTWIGLKEDLKLELVVDANTTELNGAANEDIAVGTAARPVTFLEQDADETAEVNEVQILDCVCDQPCAGSVTLSLYGRILPRLSPNSSLLDLKAAIESIPEVDLVNITGFSNASGTLCDADGVTHAITFLANPGNVPPITLSNSAPMSIRSYLSPGNESFLVRHGDFRNGTHGGMSRDGSRVLQECSGRGFCNRVTGECACYSRWGDSDRVGVHQDAGFGQRKDCSRSTAHINDCPASCLGRGLCRGPTFVCACTSGFTGYACESRTCPTAAAWFDEARPVPDTGNTTSFVNSAVLSATDSASGVTYSAHREQGLTSSHRLATCGGQGVCNGASGVCVCAEGFTGSDCGSTTCSGQSLVKGQGGTELFAEGCSGHGSCISMGQAANASRDAITKESYVGEVLPYDEWDKDKNFGCSCERAAYTGPYHDSRGDYFGPDCKRSTCPAGADPERTEVAVDADGNRLVPYPSTLPVSPIEVSSNGRAFNVPGAGTRNLTREAQVAPRFARQRITCNASSGFVIMDFKGTPSVFILSNTSVTGPKGIEASLESMNAMRDVSVHPATSTRLYTGWFRNVTTFYDSNLNQTNTSIVPFNSTCTHRLPDSRDYLPLHGADGVEGTSSELESAECWPFQSLCGVTSEGEPHAVDVTFVSEHGRQPPIKLLSSNLKGGYISFQTVVEGSKESVECSRRGACDLNLGRCVCAPQFGSSNGAFDEGPLGDCGHRHALYGFVLPDMPAAGRSFRDL
ncbi:hypothetical protein FNF28_01205 [Cafeteria roenbergensis]|uniref:EGF-like domain-containing protein n=1 Tax=Cafeteria roenbergensis TaxID=33653 RepID=A0A5A8E0P9_CAFRO|nr:hypothetical protein FNF28_01205 [Cafeteria roenbergensis]